MKKYIFPTLVLSLLSLNLSAQQTCYKTHKEKCEPATKQEFIMSGQSKSGTFIPGDTVEVTLTFYKNVEYRVSFCSANPDVQGKVQFKVMDFVTESVYEEVITYEEQWPEPEYSEDTYEETDEYGGYDDYGYEEEPYVEEPYVEVEPVKVPVVTKRKVYKKVPVVAYDNTSDGGESGQFPQEYYTIAQETKTVTFKVYIPGKPEEKEKDKGAKGSAVAYVCVGLLVEHKPAPKLGFK